MPDERERTRLQEIALEYVERYWTRLHSADRIIIIREGLTAQERQAVREALGDKGTGWQA